MLVCLSPFHLSQARGGSRGRVQGVRTPPPPEMTCSFLIQLVFCEKKKPLCGLLVLKSSKRRVHPLLKKILDPPLPSSLLRHWTCLILHFASDFYLFICRNISLISDIDMILFIFIFVCVFLGPFDWDQLAKIHQQRTP